MSIIHLFQIRISRDSLSIARFDMDVNIYFAYIANIFTE